MKGSSGARARSAAWLVPLAVVASTSHAVSCARKDEPTSRATPAEKPSASAVPPPKVLFLPDAASPPEVLPPSAGPSALRAPRTHAGRCPADMVDVLGRLCIDRFEATLSDASTGRLLSPFYHPTPDIMRREFERWQRLKAEAETTLGTLLGVPPPSEWELAATHIEPVASSVADVIPHGYLCGRNAERTLANSGMRLCMFRH